MYFNYPYLKDFDFLKEFDNSNHKTQKVKVTILDFKENPIKEIQGRVTSGSVNIDGSSAVRRTCNLSMVADNYGENLININNLLSINKKVSLEIGFKNTFLKYQDYEYLWFPLGVFVVFNPSCTHSKDGLNISFQGKDKMCLLNGECGGTLPAAVIFHEQEEKDELTGIVTITKPTVFNIIKELVNHFGGEQLTNILISDVPLMIQRVLKWNGDDPLYLIDNGKGSYSQDFSGKEPAENSIAFNKKQEIGYEYTEFSYPGELAGNTGDTVCTILDKIKNTLGNYEYYYDVNGVFIFQEIKNFLNTTEAKTILNKLENSTESQYEVNLTTGKAAYVFETHNLIESFTNSPQYNMIKNDFIVWGQRENAQGNPVPIRYHLAIDKKPNIGNTYEAVFYIEPDTYLLKAKPVIKGFSSLEDLQKQNPKSFYGYYKVENKDNNEIAYYEYYPEVEGNYRLIDSLDVKTIITKDWREELYYSGLEATVNGTDTNHYYAELANEWPKLWNLKEQHWNCETQTENGEYVITESGTELDYFLDFIDVSANIGVLNVDNIGRRSKIVSDDSINCIFEPEIPNFFWRKVGDMTDIEQIFYDSLGENEPTIQVTEGAYSKMITGGTYNSAFLLIRDLLVQHTNYNESITVVSQPIYYLEPNTLISVNDTKSGIQGDYLIKSFSIPLAITGNMTLSCTKVLEKI